MGEMINCCSAQKTSLANDGQEPMVLEAVYHSYCKAIMLLTVARINAWIAMQHKIHGEMFLLSSHLEASVW